MLVAPDRIFADPRLAAIYDDVDGDRSDLDAYAAMVAEFGARSVLDIGCGTGTFACRLASSGLSVVGIDPAQASLDIARHKVGAHLVRWLLGDTTDLAATLLGLHADLATMTANVAQVFVHDDDWHNTLRTARDALRPGGRLVFEVRDPARRAWESWNRDTSYSKIDLGAGEVVEYWLELVDVALPLVSFRSMFCFNASDEVVTSTSTLRFRERDEIECSLADAGLELLDVRDAPDRPNEELVFVSKPAAT